MRRFNHDVEDVGTKMGTFYRFVGLLCFPVGFFMILLSTQPGLAALGFVFFFFGLICFLQARSVDELARVSQNTAMITLLLEEHAKLLIVLEQIAENTKAAGAAAPHTNAQPTPNK